VRTSSFTSSSSSSSDLLADSGLSNAKLFRCSGEALLFGDAREVKKITEFHSKSVNTHEESDISPLSVT
jgi:hypothetical protein